MRVVRKPRQQKSRRPMWWLLALLGAAIGVCGYLLGTRYYGDPETKNLGNLAFWGMLAGGWLALYAAMHLIQPALRLAGRSTDGQPTARNASSHRQDAV
ncbi:hypothetical protein ACWD4J_28685 [Streptomyces sp. NPDC002577]